MLNHELLIPSVLIIGLVASSAYYLSMLYSAREFFRSWKEPAPAGELPPISILKPLKGLDVGLFANLASLCEQDYERFQLILGVADSADPALSVVRQLQTAYPQADITPVVDPRVYGTNYKISNLHNMYRHAKHDLIVIADSDIRVQRDHLRRLATGLRDPRVGLVTCLYRAVNAGGLPSALETLFINTDFCGMVLVARKVEPLRYAFGATIGIRRHVLTEVGGFLPIANYLADDYQLGQRVAARGYTLALNDQLVDTVTDVGGWRRLYQHQMRWARTQRICRPGGYFASVLTHGTFWACATLLCGRLGSPGSLAALAVIGLRIFAAATLSRHYLRTGTRIRDLALVPIKDLCLSVVWLLAFVGDTVSWNGRRLQVLPSGEMLDLTANAPTAGAWSGAPVPPLPEQRPTVPPLP